jgi:hypothetical protein
MGKTSNVAHVPLRDRPLVVCDVDEVVLEFVTPFTAFLRANDHDLLPRSFRLHGNIVSLRDGSASAPEAIAEFQELFFITQDQWQAPVERAVETLATLSEEADIVFLTAMPARHQPIRRALLDRFGLPFPLIATEEAKGPVVARLHGGRPLPVAFLDDIQRNLLSVRDHVPDCLLISLMANAEFRALAPPPIEGIAGAADWTEVECLLRVHFGSLATGVTV